MQNQEALPDGGEIEPVTVPVLEFDEWASFGDDDIMQQQAAIQAEESKKVPFVGDKVRPTA